MLLLGANWHAGDAAPNLAVPAFWPDVQLATQAVVDIGQIWVEPDFGSAQFAENCPRRCGHPYSPACGHRTLVLQSWMRQGP